MNQNPPDDAALRPVNPIQAAIDRARNAQAAAEDNRHLPPPSPWPGRLKWGLGLLAVGTLGWLWLRDPVFVEGVQAPRPPRQHNVQRSTLAHEEHTLQVVADYEFEGVIFIKRRYSNRAFSDLIPWDIGLGWEAMSDGKLLNELEFSNWNRHLFIESDKQLELAPEIAGTMLANVHLVPANDEVRAVLKAAEATQVLSIRGKLVNVLDEDGRVLIETSTTRTDRGTGACEVIYVETASVRDAVPGGQPAP